MAEGKSLSTKDLFLLTVGLYKLKDPPDKVPAEEYWLNKDGSLRESTWNWAWFASPQLAWESVRYRDWLIATIAANLTGNNQDFGAISEPMLISLDVLTNEFKPDMPNASDAVKQIVVTKSGFNRSFLTTLSLGLSKHQSGGKEVILLGAGMRRRTRVWVEESQALQADVEFFMPFCAVPGEGHSATDLLPGARSICAGIAISRANGSSIGVDADGEEIAAARFNFRIPFTAQMRESQDDLVTSFDAPVIKAQKRAMPVDLNSEPAPWEKFKDWKSFVKEFCKKPDSGELLNAPIGPLLLETVDDDSSIKDILLIKKKGTEIKKELKELKGEVKKELEEEVQLLKGLWKGEAPDKKPKPETVLPGLSERKLGGLLVSLGLLNGKGSGSGNYTYTMEKLDGLTVWDVVNRLFDELDGFPLYLSGAKPKDDKGTRMAVTLASKADETDKLKHYFGLAGLAYNIPLIPASEEDPAAKDGDPNASKIVLDKDNFTEDASILIQEDEEEETGGVSIVEEKKPEDKSKKKSTVEMRLQLGKWFDGETLDDNWFRRLLPSVKSSEKSVWKRRVPLPGIRILPFKRVHDAENNQAAYSLSLRGDLLSVGFDLKGTTKDGLTFLKADKGPLAYFGLGAIEARLALLMSADRVAIGVGIKLKDLRLSFGPKKEKEKKKANEGSGDDILGPLEDLLADDWVMVPEPEKLDKPLTTRLSAKKQDKFSISVGYLSPLSLGSGGTLDIQLYDKKGNRGKMVWIPIDRRSGTVYLKQIGIGLKGVENVELGKGKGLSDKAQLTIALTGGLRWPVFELGFIGAKFLVPLTKPGNLTFALDGLDVSLKIDPVVISGSFLKSGLEYAGSLTIDLPKLSIAATGFYGNMHVFSMSLNPDLVASLNKGEVHPKLGKELADNKIKPAVKDAIKRHHLNDEWELRADDDKSYIINKDGGELNVLSPDKTMFVYGVVNAASGGGVTIGPIQLTGFAFGFGLNRWIKVPPIEKVAEFPLVQMVMGKGGYQEDDKSGDIRNQLGQAIENPVDVLEKMGKWLPAKRDQTFICAGVRFTIATTVDCFGLIIVQFGKEFEFSLLGLARFRQPRDLSARALCYIEMQILMTIKPSEGSFKLQALLTSNSWIINENCKLTGGFALYAWFGGEHKDDFVITLGGYHPRFRRPDHYPVVPRLGLNWSVSDKLSIKGGVYLAITPSCGMLGAKLEATFHSGRISAWFTAYLDVIIDWSPLHFEAEIGISLRVEAAFAITSIKATISATVQMWGPPVGGLAHVDLKLISFDVPFGSEREQAKPKLIETWREFCGSFLNASKADEEATVKPVAAIPITQPNLASGRSNPNNLPRARQELADDHARPGADTAPPEVKREDAIWIVRGDQLELAASAAVPVTTLNVGRVKTNSPPEGIQDPSLTGKSLLVKDPVVLDPAGLRSKKFSGELGIHPMGKKLESVLNVTVVRDDIAQRVDLEKWIIEEETGSLPAALWDPAKPNPKGPSEPSAKLIPNCITGIKRLRPPVGELGQKATLTEMVWHKLGQARVPKSGASQESPPATGPRNVQAVMAARRAEQKRVVDTLAAAGFSLAWQPAQTEIRFRELQAEPMAGAVATTA